MDYDWYRIFDLNEFIATGLVSRTYKFLLEGAAEESFLVCKGEGVSVLFRDVFLPIDFEGYNPYVRDGYAIYKNENDIVFIGIEVPS